jgi:hypothetical protein
MRWKDLKENIKGRAPPLPKEIESTLPPTIVIPELQNNDTYKQYRYLLALAAAQAHENGEITFNTQSSWNENTSVVCYTPEEQRIVELANKLMGVSGKEIVKTKSHEDPHVNTRSPVPKRRSMDS